MYTATIKTKHEHPLYYRYHNIKSRCYNIHSEDYKNYGARGITLCDEWLDSADGFEKFVAHMGVPPKGMTIDRINNDKGYEPGNVRWATRQQQNLNQRHITHPYIRWVSQRRRWVVSVSGHYVGIFKDMLDAERARDAYLHGDNDDA